MEIVDIKIGEIDLPLSKSYTRGCIVVKESEEIVVKVFTECGEVGVGSAVATPNITGETKESIIGAIRYLRPLIIGQKVENIEGIMKIVNKALMFNNSAKAAIDMALYDLMGKSFGVPLYKLLGGHQNSISTSITINFASTEEMVSNALEAIMKGYSSLKLKVGYDAATDIARITAIRKAIRKGINLRIDANQGWRPKEAVKIIRTLEDLGLDIEFIEQPVKAWDVEGLQYVTDHVATEILADESVLGPPSAFKVIKSNVADLISIKLMKSGGLHNAIKIYDMADTTDIRTMMGCMLESKIGITAAASLAVAKINMIQSDLDTMFTYNSDHIIGGANISGDTITLPEKPGLGIEEVLGFKEIKG
ncbi:L-alanine-DL-glutamate epimerase [Clostridium collagenovorans DSM 3089]|uniref:Dipeptide epimerase n=1 Tax=Clostridium collagenovorans DSM 3089 TaxID=1121306 RepID=A0A1M5XWF3_9CLOT|nr:dipeptide epimerase [Clostridium collagenovorans]SHI03858.1 L-alanine-DL-glutamate epimerase [Clostridium collagenovorans DSM 3089]